MEIYVKGLEFRGESITEAEIITGRGVMCWGGRVTGGNREGQLEIIENEETWKVTQKEI